MENVLLIDYGSTYTKVTAVNLSESRLLGTASAFTTVETDVSDGLNTALDELYGQTGKITVHKTLAASSAAGGLKMVAVGLVPELTAKAASTASMGAGAKVIGSYSFELTEDDAAEIAEEGKKLKHCVGGYAERHILGKLAILFLRDAANPEKPLVTIEMSGKKLIQLHGYNNDRNEKVEPRVKYAEILDVWLEWVSAGSKRNKSGKPKIPKVEKAPQAEFAVAS